MAGDIDNPLSVLAFRGSWRNYQQDALDAVREYLADGRVHIVAAPGSGKTVLGIELARELKRPTVILAPTIAIRDQWVDRIAQMFLAPGTAADAVASNRIDDGRPITVLTYQMLYSLVSEEAQDSLLTAWLEKHRTAPSTLVLDEAHHLRREWWRAIETLRAGIGEHSIIALTATPPYDVEPQEWIRYENLCGPIDAEIGAPALVQTGDLCPHQDLIHLSRPPLKEEELYHRYAGALTDYLERLVADPALIGLVETHAWVLDPFYNEEAILESPELFTAFLTLLSSAGRRVPPNAKKLLGVGQAEIPAMSSHWMERLLNGLLFELEPQCPEERAYLRSVEQDLRRLGTISGNKVSLSQDSRFATSFASSLAKLESVVTIARAEHDGLASDLRLLILSDTVRAADMPKAPGQLARPVKLGVVPIFEALRTANDRGMMLGILTGTLVVIPVEAASRALQSAEHLGLKREQLSFRPLLHDSGFVRVVASGKAAERMVALITCLFEAGDITALIGTQSLLGEGWDAPCINAMAIASNVGTSMLSNQIRGRAIRSDPRHAGKTANIWHLATVIPGAGSSKWRQSGRDDLDLHGGWGPDMATLARRFRSFEGLAPGVSMPIESGLARMQLPADPNAEGDWAAPYNAATIAKAHDRQAIANSWRSALIHHGAKARIRRQLVSNHAPARLFVGDTLQYLALSGLGGGMLSAAGGLKNLPATSDFASLVLTLGALTLLYSIPKTGKAIWLWFRNGTIERRIGQVAQAAIDAMADSDIMVGSTNAIDIHLERDVAGRARLSLLNVSREGERLILRAVEEVIGPIANPRYLLVRRSSLFGGLRLDYHPVPSILGQKKESAEDFAARWRRYVGPCRLVYCRTAKGRRDLLRARARSMANAMQHWQDQLSVWE